MRRPFLWFLISLSVGIATAEYAEGWITAAVVIAITAAAVFFAVKNKIWEPMYMPFIAVIGFMLCRSAMLPADKAAESMTERNINICGTVRESHISDSGRIVVALDTKYITDGGIYCGEGLKIYLTADEADVRAGDIIEAEARLYTFEEPTNPYQTDYRKYMLSKGFDYSAWCEKAEKTGESGGLIYWIEGLREEVNDFWEENLPEKEASLAKALTTGYKYDIDSETETVFRNMGISHALAISGLHISAVSGIIFYILTKIFHLKKRKAIPIVSAFLILFLAFTGFSPSAVRAVIMAVTTFAALLLYKNSDGLNTVAFSAFVMLCVNPLYLRNVSFQLSYFGITAVVFAGDIVKEIKGKVTKTVIFSTVVWAAVTPVTMYYFGGTSLASVLSNIIAVPYISLVTGLAVPSALLFFTPLGKTAAKVIYILLHLYNTVSESVPTGLFYIETAKPSLYAVAAVYIFMLTAVIFRKNRVVLKRTAAVFGVFLAVMAGINLGAEPETVFFDAGQGDASVIYIPNELTAVIDGGPKGGGTRAVMPYLKAKGTKADILFITHTDSDHADGAIELINEDMVRQIVLSDTNHSDKLDEVLKAANENNVPIFYAAEGDIVETESCRIECIYPDGRESRSENSASLVLAAKINGTEILFTGDIEAEDEEYLLGKTVSCDIIKIAHHGSKTSSTENFIAATGAYTAVIEAAEGNIYGFPHEEVLERLENYGMDVYVTGNDGAVTVICDRDGYRIRTFKGEKRK